MTSFLCVYLQSKANLAVHVHVLRQTGVGHLTGLGGDVTTFSMHFRSSGVSDSRPGEPHLDTPIDRPQAYWRRVRRGRWAEPEIISALF